MSFGPESTNPREKRAYAHAKRDKALKTGMSRDKIDAVEAAIHAGSSKKGKDLGREAVAAFNGGTPRADKEFNKVFDVTTFIQPDRAKAMDLVSKAVGPELGVRVTQNVSPNDPNSRDIFAAAAMKHIDLVREDSLMRETLVMRVPASPEDIVSYNEGVGNHAVTVVATHSTGPFNDAVRSLASDTPPVPSTLNVPVPLDMPTLTTTTMPPAPETTTTMPSETTTTMPPETTKPPVIW